MVKIRLSRSGVRNHPFYRIVAVADERKGKGQFLEIIGFWHPAKNTVKINQTALDKWLQTGAQISPAVNKILKKEE